MTRSLLLFAAAFFVACTPAGTAPKADTTIAVEAMRVLSADDMEGRRAGSEGNAKARAYIIEQATILNGGTAPEELGFERSMTRRNGDTVEVVGSNLRVILPGLDSGGPVLEITAHYDHIGMRGDKIFNGADDNASGSGALLSILKSFRADPPDHDIHIVWLDAEEMGLAGARDYVETQLDDRPRVNLNFDMIAQNEAGIIYMAGSYHTPALRPLVEQAAEAVDVEVRFGHDKPEDGADDWTMQSDHGAFHAAGIPFAYFGVEDHPHYHQATDEFDTIPVGFYREVVQLTVDTAHLFDENLDAIAKPRTLSTQP